MGFRLTSTILLISSLVFLSTKVYSFPLCSDSRAPITLRSPLKFCPYNESSCCNTTQDSQLRKQFLAMNISDSACASIIKSILCAKCDPFSSELFKTNSSPIQVPLLCNSTMTNSSQSNQAQQDYCSQVWETCQNVTLPNSPFTIPIQTKASSPSTNSNSTKITEIFNSKLNFCNAYGGSSTDGSVCFSGEPVNLNSTVSSSSPTGLCLEKISNGSYLDMAAYPDGSNRAFFASQSGKIWLGTIPNEGSNGLIEIDESNPFLDISDQVHQDSEFGLLGIALHPKFDENGRFFVSFNCDKSSWPGCSGRCSCNSDNDCDPSKLPSDSGTQPCQFHSVIAEYSATTQPSLATTARPTEVRRIFTMGLPFTSHHSGQILFGPKDKYLYFTMGDGGRTGDPYNFAQNKKSLLGKILRLDIDHFPSATEVSKLGLWGNYSIPNDNPYIDDKALEPEIWALGLRNPWKCSFDSERSSYLMCADVGQDVYEEVDIITKGGNYGWRVYEGNTVYNPPESPGGNTSANSVNAIFPVMGYNHSDVNPKLGSASISGGFFYRSTTDPCMYGRYLYADLYGGYIWEGTENPKDSGNFTSKPLSFKCATDSPIKCKPVTQGSSVPSLDYVFSFGQDNNRDVFLLTSNGVYRVARPSRCQYTCSKETAMSAPTPAGPASSSSSAGGSVFQLCKELAFLVGSIFVCVHLLDN
ncbi:hypothetical protein V2J09_006763 [Rumex salicifolius]